MRNEPVLRRIRCSARNRAGNRCGRWAALGAAVCSYHGASPAVRENGQRRELIAELLQGDPRPLAVVLRDSVAVADAVLQDLVADVTAGDITPDTIDRLVLAAGRASQLARTALDAGVADDAAETITRQHGSAIASAMAQLTSALLPRVAAGRQDGAALRDWIRQAVPAVLRGQPVPPPPPLWRMTSAPQLESGEAIRERERRAVAVVLGEAEEAVLSGREAVLDRESTEPPNGAPGYRPVARATVSEPRVTHSEPVPPTVEDLRRGRGFSPWRDDRSPLTRPITEED
jgi:hypothetical protein